MRTNNRAVGWLGWPRYAWLFPGVVAASLGLIALLTIAIHGLNDDTLGSLARNGARSALLLFALAFSASALHHFLPGSMSKWLLAHRSYLGVSFAVAHFSFLGANLTRVAVVHAGDFFALRPPNAWIFGGLAYALITAMVVTSFPGPAAKLGRRAWSLLHSLGSWVIALGFLNSYGQRALTMPEYIPFGLLILSVILLRWAHCLALCTRSAPWKRARSAEQVIE